MATRLCGFDLPDHSGNRPVFAPETREQSVSKRGEGDKRARLHCGFLQSVPSHGKGRKFGSAQHLLGFNTHLAPEHIAPPPTANH
jgi:hypothetical protein